MEIPVFVISVTHRVLSPPITTQSFTRDWFNLLELPDRAFNPSSFTSPLEFSCLFNALVQNHKLKLHWLLDHSIYTLPVQM